MEPIKIQNKMELTAGQQEFVTHAEMGRNIYLTGKAGTGKSFIVREVMDRIKKSKRFIVAVAPTGIAAMNINGQTIHSMFWLAPFGILTYAECKAIKGAKRDVLKHANTIVIDEISMLRPDILDAMHWTLKKSGLPGLDKRQVIFVGDMKQLEPVIDDNERSVLLRTYNGTTFMDSHIFKKLNVQRVELCEMLRQTDPEFIENLNVVRDGRKSEYFRQFVSKEPKGIILAPHNATVHQYNEKGLAAQNGQLYTFTAEINGTAKPEDFHLEQEINVKNGCKIMYLVNSYENPLRNGTMGIFVSHEGCHFIRVGQTDFALEPVKLEKKKYVYNQAEDDLELVTLGEIIQYPFKLAYALSIHKSQGLTFEEMTLDLSRPVFQRGQMYVALSRVKTPQGLRIIL